MRGGGGGGLRNLRSASLEIWRASIALRVLPRHTVSKSSKTFEATDDHMARCWMRARTALRHLTAGRSPDWTCGRGYHRARHANNNCEKIGLRA